jgi:hypothetical protein
VFTDRGYDGEERIEEGYAGRQANLLVGDTITLRLEVEHEINLADVHAIFRRQGDTFEVWLRLREYGLTLMEWQGERRISEVILEAEVDSNKLPGDYELIAVRGQGVGIRANSTPGLEFDFPEGVRFRIASPDRFPVPRVKFHEFQPPS